MKNESITPFLSRHRNGLIAVVCLLAALRLFIFSAAFPFFGNVDECQHVDTVLKYAKGCFPRPGTSAFESETVRLIVLYGSNEFYKDPAEWKRIDRGPAWRKPMEFQEKTLKAALPYWRTKMNHEANATPPYYFLAGIWTRLGEGIGLKDGTLLYWIRFFNIPVYCCFVFLAYAFCGKFYADKPVLTFGVPLLLAIFPQDLFYTVTSDVPSCLLFLLSMFLTMRLVMEDRSAWFHALTGLVIGATFLSKIINAPVFLLWIAVAFMKWKQAEGAKEKSRAAARCLVMAAAALLPVALWLGRNALLFGDVTVYPDSSRFRHLVPQSVSQIISHPVFSFGGMRLFISRLLRTFWRGELQWHLLDVHSNWMDHAYVVTTCVFLSAALIQIAPKRRVDRFKPFQIQNAAVFFSFPFMLFLMSILLRFGDGWMPNRFFPYWTYGRYMAGALFPFAVLYVSGLEWLLSKISRRIHPLWVLSAWVLLILISEIWISSNVFKSQYNFYHFFMK